MHQVWGNSGFLSALLGQDTIECSRDCNASDFDVCHAKLPRLTDAQTVTPTRTDHQTEDDPRKKSTAGLLAGSSQNRRFAAPSKFPRQS